MFLVPQREKRKIDQGGAPSWNSGDYAAWHPALLFDLIIGVIVSPQWLDGLMQDEDTRNEISRTGLWLCLTLLVLPVLTLLIALDFNAAHWLLLIDVRGLTALFFWALLLGAAAAVAVITDQPVLFFLASMTAFFMGLVIGLVALLIAEIWLRLSSKWRRPWLGHLNLILLLVSHGVGVLLLSRYAF